MLICIYIITYVDMYIYIDMHINIYIYMYLNMVQKCPDGCFVQLF